MEGSKLKRRLGQKRRSDNRIAYKPLKGTRHNEPLVKIDDAEDDMQAIKPWVVVDSVRLYDEEKKILIDSQWLSDSLIHAAQLLIKRDKDLLGVGSLQNPLYGAQERFEVMTGEFVQILHSGGNRWIAISTVGTDNAVWMYDSLYTCLPLSTKKLIVSLLHCQEKSFTLEYANVQVNALHIN